MKIAISKDRRHRKPLPPWVDLEQVKKTLWVSPAIPWLPVDRTKKDDVVESVILAAEMVRQTPRGNRFMTLRLIKGDIRLGPGGAKMERQPGDEEILASGHMRMEQFAKSLYVPIGRCPSVYSISFYEDGVEVHTSSVPGSLCKDPQLVVNVCRGFDRPKKEAKANMTSPASYAVMTFLWNEGGKSFGMWSDRMEMLTPEEGA